MVYSIVINNKDYCMCHPYVIALFDFATSTVLGILEQVYVHGNLTFAGTCSARLVVFSSVYACVVFSANLTALQISRCPLHIYRPPVVEFMF